MQIQQGDNLARAKINNQNAIRRIIYFYGPITRQEISRCLNLTLPTITTNINNMIKNGLVKEADYSITAAGALGRKSYPVDVVANAHYFIGIEMRGMLRRLCVTDYRGKVFYEAKDDTAFQEYESVVQATANLITKCLHAQPVPLEKISGIGIGIPGLADTEAGVLNNHPGYCWQNKSVVKDLSDLIDFNCSITLSNNTYVRALGMQLFHREALNSIPSFGYLFISTGIACPVIINTSRTALSNLGAGEIGHIIVQPGGRKCQCGNSGCLEAYSSDLAIIKRCEKRMAEGKTPILASVCQNKTPTIEQITQAQRLGESGITDIIEEALFYLGIAVANLDNILRPHTVFIDGILFINEQNRQLLSENIRNNIYNATKNPLQLQFLEKDTYSGAKGAAALAIQKELKTYID